MIGALPIQVVTQLRKSKKDKNEFFVFVLLMGRESITQHEREFFLHHINFQLETQE